MQAMFDSAADPADAPRRAAAADGRHEDRLGHPGSASQGGST
jgi:hypothetical protein